MSAGRAVHLWAARSESSTRNAIRTAHETRPLLLVSRRRGEALYQVKPPTPPTPQTPPTPRVNLAALNIRRWYQLDTRKSNPIFVSSALWFLPARGRKTRVTYRYRVTKKKKIGCVESAMDTGGRRRHSFDRWLISDYLERYCGPCCSPKSSRDSRGRRRRWLGRTGRKAPTGNRRDRWHHRLRCKDPGRRRACRPCPAVSVSAPWTWLIWSSKCWAPAWESPPSLECSWCARRRTGVKWPECCTPPAARTWTGSAAWTRPCRSSHSKSSAWSPISASRTSPTCFLQQPFGFKTTTLKKKYSNLIQFQLLPRWRSNAGRIQSPPFCLFVCLFVLASFLTFGEILRLVSHLTSHLQIREWRRNAVLHGQVANWFITRAKRTLTQVLRCALNYKNTYQNAIKQPCNWLSLIINTNCVNKTVRSRSLPTHHLLVTTNYAFTAYFVNTYKYFWILQNSTTDFLIFSS